MAQYTMHRYEEHMVKLSKQRRMGRVGRFRHIRNSALPGFLTVCKITKNTGVLFLDSKNVFTSEQGSPLHLLLIYSLRYFLSNDIIHDKTQEWNKGILAVLFW
jgi:hypothetical protein